MVTEKLPFVVGRNVIRIVHELFAAKVVPHPLAKEKFVVSDSEIPVIDTADELVLVTVTLSTELWPTFTPPKPGGGVMTIAPVPVPVSVTTNGALNAVLVMVSVPVLAPDVAGLKNTWIVQLLLAATELPQLF